MKEILSSINFAQSIISQLWKLISGAAEAPYNALVSNSILLIIAAVIIPLGILARQMIIHPDELQSFIMKLRERPFIRKSEQYFQGWLSFLLNRFRTGEVYGLSFTTSLAVLAASIWFFGSVLEDLLNHNGSALVDIPVASFIVAHRINWLNGIMQIIAAFGSPIFIAVLLIGAGIFIRQKIHSWRPFWFMVIMVGGAGFLDFVFNFFIVRPRPISMVFSSVGAYDAFAGQIATTIVYAVLAYFIAATSAHWRNKIRAWFIALGIIFLIGVANVYLEQQWTTDILAAWSLAFLWMGSVLLFQNIIGQNTGRTIHGLSLFKIDSGATKEIKAHKPSEFIVSPSGLTEAQVKERLAKGQLNIVKKRASRSLGDIFRKNIFTRFNALFAGLFVIILFLGEKQDAAFGLIVISNTAIGIIQELRAKRTLDRLQVLIAPQARVIRSGTALEIPADEIVIDDVIELRPGDQISVDGKIIAADSLEVNESLLTGEADPVVKKIKESVLSGSFVVAGNAYIQAINIGRDSYANRLANEAGRFTLSDSELRKGINKILQYVAWIIIPTACFLLINQLLYGGIGWRDSIVSSIGGLLGMIPQGLILLTSLVLATAIVRLAKQKAVIQELNAVEMLARVDVLMLDKTGTLTTGKMKCEELITICKEALPVQPEVALGMIAHLEQNPNPSLAAMQATYGAPAGADWSVLHKVPFSSARKWSGVSFKKYGTWILGAPEVIMRQDTQSAEVFKKIELLAENGKRVIALAYSDKQLSTSNFTLSRGLKLISLIIMSEQIRSDVRQALSYFQEQHVKIKVISGDHPKTVKAVAKACGITDGTVAFDARNLPENFDEVSEIIGKYNLFGRVTPDQKQLMVKALQHRGHIVAMTGDGINDVLAIKKADFGIAMGAGTAASRSVAQLILLNNNFTALPHVIAEGKRAIANIERTAKLFIIKTTYVFIFALAVGIARVPFLFLPRHLTLIDFLTIGTPAVILSFAKNTTQARAGFLSRLFRFTIPAGTITAAATLVAYAIARQLAPESVEVARTAATLMIIGCGFLVLMLVAGIHHLRQLSFWPVFPFILVLALAIPSSRAFFTLALPPFSVWMTLLTLEIICAWILIKKVPFKETLSTLSD